MTRRPSIAELLGDEPANAIEADIRAAKETLGEGFGGDVFTGLAFADAHRDRLVYIPERGHWLEFDGTRFTRCDAGALMQAFASRESTAASAAEIKMRKPTFEARQLTKHMTDLLRFHYKQKAALACASELPACRVAANALDADPWVMGVPNGVLDLRRGRLVDAEPGQRITKQAGAIFDPDAKAPLWESFLETALPDPDARAFAQRAVGYTLIGVVDEEKLFFAHGPGGSGKSTFANVIEAVFGDYATTVLKEMLVRGNFSDSESKRQVARLPGVRLASINETSAGDVFDDYKVKQVTSREKIAARFHYKEMFDFYPTHTTWLRGNFTPGVMDSGDGFWRRLVPIEFGVQIPARDRIADLDRRIIESELPGVLAWAVRGALAWQKGGLAIPASTTAKTEAYREATDLFGAWLSEYTRRVPTAKTKISELFDSWSRYCHSNGLSGGITRGFADELSRRGYERDKSNKHGKRFVGIALTGGFDDLD